MTENNTRITSKMMFVLQYLKKNIYVADKPTVTQPISGANVFFVYSRILCRHASDGTVVTVDMMCARKVLVTELVAQNGIDTIRTGLIESQRCRAKMYATENTAHY